MMRLITPPSLLVTTALLAVYSVYAARMAFIDNSWLHAGFAVLAAGACIGTAIMRPLSRYLVYFLTAAFIVAWFLSVYEGAKAGYFEFAYSSPLAIARALAPGILLVILSGACSYLVFRHFRGAALRRTLSQNREIT